MKEKKRPLHWKIPLKGILNVAKNILDLFFFFNSLCITVYNSHLACNREAETVYRSPLSETEKCNPGEVGSRVAEIASPSPRRGPLNLAPHPNQRNGARLREHFCVVGGLAPAQAPLVPCLCPLPPICLWMDFKGWTRKMFFC